jgi:hypothetical protein
MLKDRGDDQARRRLEEVIGELLEGPLGGLVRRIERSELDRLEAMPEAVFALEAEEGFVFGTNREGPLMTSSSYFGHHGYLPTRPKMKTGFLMVGPRVRQGIEVPYMRQVDIAPTIAFWAGWDLPEADGLALQGLFEKPD